MELTISAMTYRGILTELSRELKGHADDLRKLKRQMGLNSNRQWLETRAVAYEDASKAILAIYLPPEANGHDEEVIHLREEQ